MSSNLPEDEDKDTRHPKKIRNFKNKNSYHHEDFLSYLKGNVRETIAYVLLVLGILLIYFQPLIGGILVGLVAGVYFGDEIIRAIRNWKDFIETEGMARSLVVAGVTFAFFLSAPAIFIGAAIALLIKQLFNPS